jgi:hypothetical protein
VGGASPRRRGFFVCVFAAIRRDTGLAALPSAQSTKCRCIATVQYMAATLLAHAKEVRDDGSIVEIVI